MNNWEVGVLSELAGVIQKIVQNTIQAMKLTDMSTGTVISAAPLSVQPDASLPPLPSAALILTDTVRERSVLVQGGPGSVAVREGLKTGDKVLMLRVQRGNKYLVLSKIT